MSIDTTLESYPGLRERLGKESDGKLAAELGISRQRVYQIRTELGISPTQPKQKRHGSPNWMNRMFLDLRTRWIAAAPAGERRNVDALCALLGISGVTVTTWSYGIGRRRPDTDVMAKIAADLGMLLVLHGTQGAALLYRDDLDGKAVVATYGTKP